MKQITNTLLMIRPVAYRMNEQTAINNYFQENLNLSDVVTVSYTHLRAHET